MTDPEVLTPDEQLLRHPRWQGETVDLKTRLRMLAKEHSLADELDIDETEKWDAYFDELRQLITDLSEGERGENCTR